MGVDLIWRSVALEKFSDQTVAQSSLRNRLAHTKYVHNTGTVWESVGEGKESAARYHKSNRITKKTHPLLTEQSTRNTRV